MRTQSTRRCARSTTARTAGRPRTAPSRATARRSPACTAIPTKVAAIASSWQRAPAGFAASHSRHAGAAAPSPHGAHVYRPTTAADRPATHPRRKRPARRGSSRGRGRRRRARRRATARCRRRRWRRTSCPSRGAGRAPTPSYSAVPSAYSIVPAPWRSRPRGGQRQAAAAAAESGVEQLARVPPPASYRTIHDVVGWRAAAARVRGARRPPASGSRPSTTRGAAVRAAPSARRVRRARGSTRRSARAPRQRERNLRSCGYRSAKRCCSGQPERMPFRSCVVPAKTSIFRPHQTPCSCRGAGAGTPSSRRPPCPAPGRGGR